MRTFKSYLTEAVRETWYFDPGLTYPEDLYNIVKKALPSVKQNIAFLDGGLYFHGSKLLALKIAKVIEDHYTLPDAYTVDIRNGKALARNHWKYMYGGKYAKDNAFVNQSLPWQK